MHGEGNQEQTQGKGLRQCPDFYGLTDFGRGSRDEHSARAAAAFPGAKCFPEGMLWCYGRKYFLPPS